MTVCGSCHTCTRHLRTVLDGEEWCDYCQAYRRYRSHGWAAGVADKQDDGCFPDPAIIDRLYGRLAAAHTAPESAHILLTRGPYPVCQLCGGRSAPIVGGRHLNPKEWCGKG